jgi:hypothetical protein
MEDKLHVFGTYRAEVAGGGEPPIRSVQDYVQIRAAGGTLYVQLKDPANKSGPFPMYAHMETTLIVPADVRLEVIGNGNEIRVSARNLRAHWLIENAGAIHVQIDGQNNLGLTAAARLPLQQDVWDTVESPDRSLHAPFEGMYRGSLKIGDGAYRLEIVNSEWVSVSGYDRD